MTNHQSSTGSLDGLQELEADYEEAQPVVSDAPAIDAEVAVRARPIPRISIQAFCDDPQTAERVQFAAEDRRLAKAHVSVHMGGIAAATAHYEQSPSPNLIIVESQEGGSELLTDLDRLAEYCDAGTKVVVVGHMNDVVLYRELLKRGVSEYLVAPIEPLTLMETISDLYNDPESEPVGSIMAFVGAKGGVGSSTICHNAAWALSEALRSDVCIADLDLAFGTTGLDFNQDPVQGIADALSSPERLDEVLLDRLLTKCSDHLSIFAAPVVLDRDYDISAEACDSVIDVVCQSVPHVFVDLPHTWTSWSKSLLLKADEVVITASPDLPNLRNAKNIIDLLKQSRQNDGPPHLVINMANMPKRHEIPVKEFCANLEMEPTVIVDYESEIFSTASNNGQMLDEVNAKSQAAIQIRDLAMALIHRREDRGPAKKSPLAPILEKLKLSR